MIKKTEEFMLACKAMIALAEFAVAMEALENIMHSRDLAFAKDMFDASDNAAKLHAVEKVRHAERRKKTMKKAIRRQNHDQSLFGAEWMTDIAHRKAAVNEHPERHHYSAANSLLHQEQRAEKLIAHCNEKNAGRYKKCSIVGKRNREYLYNRLNRDRIREKEADREFHRSLMDEYYSDDIDFDDEYDEFFAQEDYSDSYPNVHPMDEELEEDEADSIAFLIS